MATGSRDPPGSWTRPAIFDQERFDLIVKRKPPHRVAFAPVRIDEIHRQSIGNGRGRTVAPLARPKKLTVRTNPASTNVGHGRWTGSPKAGFARTPRVATFHEMRVERPFGGETRAERDQAQGVVER